MKDTNITSHVLPMKNFQKNFDKKLIFIYDPQILSSSNFDFMVEGIPGCIQHHVAS